MQAKRRPAASLTWLSPAVWTGGLVPLAILGLDAAQGALGANPIKQATHQTGQLAIILLALSLLCTPVRKFMGWTWAARIRKALGLLAFIYALLHLGIYVYDQDFTPSSVLEDILKRPFITIGMTALALLVPLALTSTPKSVKRLGFEAWTKLHRLVYASALLASAHYYLGVKKDHTLATAFGVGLILLLATRLIKRKK